MLKITKVFMAFLLIFMLVGISTAQTTKPIEPIPSEAFSPIVVEPSPIFYEYPYDTRIVPVAPSPSPETRKAEKIDNKPKTVSTPKPVIKETGQATMKRGILKGTATWYCVKGVSRCHKNYSSGLYAAAGSELRAALGPKWRGKYVYVSHNGNTVRVKLIDWCACKGARVIDLYGDAFKRLAPLSRGVISVKISK